MGGSAGKGLPTALSRDWIYTETNGEFWLQRDDEVVDDTCGGFAAVSDTIVL